MVWLKKHALISFQIGGYKEQLSHDVVPMIAHSLLLGRPWQSDRHVIHHGRECLSVLVGDERIGLKPLSPKKISTSPATNVNTNLHICQSSCREEVLEVPMNKKERLKKLLYTRHNN